MEETDEGSAANDRRYAMLDKRDIPGGENLKVTLERALPFWQDEIAPALLDNKTVLVAAHGNSLRALAKHIEGISDEDIMDLEIPTGQPLVYELNDDLTVAKNTTYNRYSIVNKTALSPPIIVRDEGAVFLDIGRR